MQLALGTPCFESRCPLTPKDALPRRTVIRGYCLLATLSSQYADTFPRSVLGPKLHSRHIYAGGQLASIQVPGDLGFDHQVSVIDTSSVAHLCSNLRLTSYRILPLPFNPTRSSTQLLSAAAVGALQPPTVRPFEGRGSAPELLYSCNTC